MSPGRHWTTPGFPAADRKAGALQLVRRSWRPRLSEPGGIQVAWRLPRIIRESEPRARRRKGLVRRFVSKSQEDIGQISAKRWSKLLQRRTAPFGDDSAHPLRLRKPRSIKLRAKGHLYALHMPDLPSLSGNPVSFAHPPVAEVALAVQLAEPATDDTLTLGHYWPKIQSRYPRLEPQPPLPPMAEAFDPLGPPTINFQIFNTSPAGRYWFLSENGEELVQVQPDRFAYNWRKEGVAEPESPDYPRYQQLRERFYDLYSDFVDTCEAAGRSIKPTWCEITYINHIDLPKGSAIPDLATILRRVQMTPLPGLDTPENTVLNERYVLRDADAQPYGRFYVTATPGYRIEDQTPLLVLTLLVRGMAKSPDTLGVIGLLDEGRDLIVNSFKRLTTDAMHKEWGLKDAD